jgi:hypothetical protein
MFKDLVLKPDHRIAFERFCYKLKENINNYHKEKVFKDLDWIQLAQTFFDLAAVLSIFEFHTGQGNCFYQDHSVFCVVRIVTSSLLGLWKRNR